MIEACPIKRECIKKIETAFVWFLVMMQYRGEHF